MDQPPLPREDRSPTCSFFSCWSAKDRPESSALKRVSRRIGTDRVGLMRKEKLTEVGVERHMPVTQNQPHLVEPMKLTVYDDLPMTPVPTSKPAKLVKKSVTRMSVRTSISSRRTRSRSKLSISKPQPTLAVPATTLRRNPSFRPIQLSIYMEEKRLSDLPEFDSLSFTEEGSIRLPPPAVLRTQSMDLLRPRSLGMPGAINDKPASMFEQSLSRRMSHVRNNTDSTILSTSRPPSEYDALHSHPVSWYSVPGVPPQLQFATAPGLSKKVLSPMKEEFTPPPSGAVIINGKILAFPTVDAARVESEDAYRSLLPPALGQEDDSAAPSPVIDPGPNRRTMIITQHRSKISEAASIMLASSANSTRTRATTIDLPLTVSEPMPPVELLPMEEPRPYFHTDFKTNNRINQWLDNDKLHKTRSRESSISTVRTTSTTSSFAEHRRKRSQFYQLNHPRPTAADTPVTSKVSAPPAPLSLYKTFPQQKAVAGPAASEQPVSRIQPVNYARHAHSRTKSSVSLPFQGLSHTRTMTDSTIASTVETDVLFEQPEAPDMDRESRDEFHSARLPPSHVQYNPTMASLRRRELDAESMTTVDMKSRTGTMKSTATSNPRGTPEPHTMYSEREINPGVEILAVTKGQFDFSQRMTPSPAALSVRSDKSAESPRTPLSAKEADVEKMVFEMCKSSGFRRVNVGMAF